MEMNENVSQHSFLFWDMVKILVLLDVNLPFHLLTQVSTLGIGCSNLDHKLVWQTYMHKCSLALGNSTVTFSQLFDIKKSCKLIPINFEYNYIYTSRYIYSRANSTALELVIYLYGGSFFLVACILQND